MKMKPLVLSKKSSKLDDKEVRQRRVEAYLKATQPAFEASVARASELGILGTGVLAGPRVRA